MTVNNDTAVLDRAARPRRRTDRAPRPDTPVATTCSSSWTRGPTTSPTSVIAPPGRRPATSCSCRRTGRRPARWHDGHPVPDQSRSIVGRWACRGDDDLPAVHPLQDAITLTPSIRTPSPPACPCPTRACRRPLFLGQLRVWSQRSRPPRATPRAAPWPRSGSPARALTVRDPDASSRRPARRARRRADAGTGAGLGGQPGGQRLEADLHAFDYNLDFIELGALDDTGSRSPTRSCASRAGAAARPACGATTPTRRRTS